MTYTPTGETWTCPECGHKMLEMQYEMMTAASIESSAIACRCQKALFNPPRHQTPFSWDEDDPQLSYTWFDEESVN